MRSSQCNSVLFLDVVFVDSMHVLCEYNVKPKPSGNILFLLQCATAAVFLAVVARVQIQLFMTVLAHNLSSQTLDIIIAHEKKPSVGNFG